MEAAVSFQSSSLRLIPPVLQVLQTSGDVQTSAVLLALHLCARFCSRVAQRLRDKEGTVKGSRDWEAARKWEGFGSSAIALALFLIFLLYPSTSSMIFSTFICEDIDDGQSYLRADYAINCASPAHQIATAFAVAMIFVVPVGTPLLCEEIGPEHPPC